MIWSAAGVLLVNEEINKETKATMKTCARIRNFLTAATLAAALASSSANTFADDRQTIASKTGGAGSSKSNAAIGALGGYDLVISGGVLLEADGRQSTAELSAVMDALRKRYTQANIVFPPELSTIMLADLKLHAHDLPEMLEAIRVASGNKFDWKAPGTEYIDTVAPKPASTIDPQTGLPIATTAPDVNAGLYVLRVPPASFIPPPRVVEAFNIGPFLDRKILEARSRQQSEINRDELERFSMAITDGEVQRLQENIINTVASFKQTSENNVAASLKFQYHSGASLLVAIGPRDEVEVVRKMMSALVSDPNGMRVDGIRTDLIDMPVVPAGEKLQPVSVEAIPVKFAKVESAYAAAISLLADKRSKVLLTDARTKTLIVQATKAEVVAIRAAIELLDQAAKQSGGSSSGSSGSVPQKEN